MTHRLKGDIMISSSKTTKSVILLLTVIFTLSLMTGCNKQKNSENSSGITITDCAGREVVVPDNVERIGCLYAFSGHVVTMLDKGENIFAVVEGLKRDKLLNQLNPAIKDAAVPISSGAINIEELIKVHPDVIFIQSSSISNKGEKQKLEKSGIPFLVIDYNSMAQQQYAIEVIGKAIGASDKAKIYNDYYQFQIDNIANKLADLQDSDKVKVYHSLKEATRTDQKDSLPADWMNAAGLIDVSVNDELKLIDDSYYANIEQIFMWDPDVIFANEVGVPAYIMNSSQWQALRAVKDKKVYQMPIGISRWGHDGSLETPLALIWAVKTIYPDRFADMDLTAEIKKYYKEFYDLDMTDDIIAQILDGNGMRLPKGE